MKKVEQTAKVMGQFFFSKQKEELLNWLATEGEGGSKPLLIFTPNPEHLVLTREKPSFAHTLQQADIRLPDGIWIVNAARILSWVGKSAPIAERIPGVEFVADLLKIAATKKWTVAVIGGRGYEQRRVGSDWELRAYSGPSANSSAVNDSTTSSPRRVIHWLEAYRQAANPTVKEEIEVKKQLEALQPDLVFVALGAPLQEEWLVSHYDILKNNKVKIGMVVGGAFDMLTGRVQRAPLLYRKLGFEWLYRLGQQPWRWKRQLRLVRFLWELCKEVVIP